MRQARHILLFQKVVTLTMVPRSWWTPLPNEQCSLFDVGNENRSIQNGEFEPCIFGLYLFVMEGVSFYFSGEGAKKKVEGRIWKTQNFLVLLEAAPSGSRHGYLPCRKLFISFYFIHFSRLNSISIILFWENTGSSSENYQVFEISIHSFYFSM